MIIQSCQYINVILCGWIIIIPGAITTHPPPPPPPRAPYQRCHPPLGRLSIPLLSYSLRCFGVTISDVISFMIYSIFFSWVEWGVQQAHLPRSYISCRFDNLTRSFSSPKFSHTLSCSCLLNHNQLFYFSRWSCNCSGSKRKRSGKPLTGWQGDLLPLLLLLRSTGDPVNLLEL